MRSLAFVLMLAFVAVAPSAQEDVEPGVFLASNEDEPDAPVGVRPYEMDWAKRHEPNHPQLVDFENLAGWRVRCLDGADARLYRSKQELCFGDYTAKVVYTGTSAKSRFVIEPPRPIPINPPFTGVNLWVRGNNWSFAQPAAPMRARVAVLIEDAAGERYRIELDSVTFDYWCVMHRTLANPANGSLNSCIIPQDGASDTIEYPATFLGIECLGFRNSKPARLHFDALSFYVMRYPPLTFDPPPEQLLWPTTPDTILPTVADALRSVSLERDGEAFLWEAAYEGETIRVRYTPTDGSLGDITVETGGQTFQPCWRGGITFDVNGDSIRPGADDVIARCRYAEIKDGAVVADWVLFRQNGLPVTFRYEFGLKGKSLIVDVTAPGGQATQFDIGLAKGLAEPKAVYIPYFTYGGDWPRVVCSTGPDGPVFLLALVDYYNSDASGLFGSPRIDGDDALGYTGGSIYKKKTDGKRNDLRERLFINISRDVREVLPNIPNPDCDTGDIAREYVWRNIGAPQQEMLEKYKAYGIDKFIACHHEVGWRDAGESFTMRLRCAPRIGDEELARYSKHLREVLGYRFGTYTNYVDFAPVNSNWNEDDVCLHPDGTWQRAWPRCYALKPLRAVEKEAYYAPRIHDKFGTNAQYCDVHTAYIPWGRTDYDARVPGAGMFRTQFNSFARLLYNESKAHHGPVFSEGNYHWFYAGIVDGNYATMMPYGRGWQVPPVVDFDLLKMHPKMTDFGMGFANMFYGRRGPWQDDRSRLSPYFDRFITSTVAFGHIGFLTYEWDFAATLKSYYLVQALQQRYTQIPVQDIRYFDGEKLVDTSTAIATDAYLRRQVYAKYEGGLETWCNLSFEDDWTVTVDGQDYLLPPGSFLANKPGDIFVCTGAVGDQRCDLVQCADYLYLDSRDEVVRTPVLTARGQVAVKRDGKHAWWVIPCPEAEEVTIATDWLDCDGGYRFEATAHNQAGEQVGTCEVRRGAGEVTVVPYPEALKYRLVAKPDEGITGAAWRIAPVKRIVVPGSVVSVSAEIAFPDRDTVHVDLHVPSDALEYDRQWSVVKLMNADGTVVDERWFDVTVMPAFDVKILTEDAPLQPKKPVAIEAAVRSNLAEAVTVTLRLDAPADWKPSPEEHSLRLEPGKPQTVAWTLNVPRQPSVEPFTIRLHHADKLHETVRYLRVRPTEWIAADLTEMELKTGLACRGRKESPLDAVRTGASVLASVETVGGESKRSIFMHPPYKDGVGYSFAAVPVTLPEGTPHLEFALGFRAGSTSQDGCLFKVVIIDGDQGHEVFAEQYAVLDKWRSYDVDLAAFAGKPVTIKLITDVGPDDNSYSDWACWGEPRITLGKDVLAAEVHATKPELPVLPPPEPLPGLNKADLATIVSAELTLETAGVNSGPYTSYVDLNGIEIGSTPPCASDTDWHPAAVPLTPEALETLRPINTVVIRNPGGDYMKVRKLCLHFELEDGRRGSSWVDVGPYCSAKGWEFEEGQAVPIGSNLPAVRLAIAVE